MRPNAEDRAQAWWRTLLLNGLALLLLAACQGLPVGEVPRTQFHFVQITDTHFGSGDNFARAEQIATAVNRLPMPIEFVVHTGDIIMERLENPQVVARTREVLGRFRAPVYTLPGNHDLVRERHAAHLRIYREQFAELVTTHLVRGVWVVTFYGESAARNFPVPGYDPLAVLEQALRQGQGRPVLLFQHTPPVGGLFRNRIREGWPPAVRARWEALIKAYDVRAVFAGHFHKDELHWIGDVPLFVAPPVADSWGRQASFRIYQYRDGRLSYRTLYMDNTRAPANGTAPVF